jgi:hypothetical protein
MLFRVGYTLPYDKSGVIENLSQVQNFLDDEGDSAPFKSPKRKGAHPPSGKPWCILCLEGLAEREINISKTKTSVGGLNKAFFTI